MGMYIKFFNFNHGNVVILGKMMEDNGFFLFDKIIYNKKDPNSDIEIHTTSFKFIGTTSITVIFDENTTDAIFIERIPISELPKEYDTEGWSLLREPAEIHSDCSYKLFIADSDDSAKLLVELED